MWVNWARNIRKRYRVTYHTYLASGEEPTHQVIKQQTLGAEKNLWKCCGWERVNIWSREKL